MIPLFVVCLVAGVTSLNVPMDNLRNFTVNYEDYPTFRTLSRRQIGTNMPGFHYIFVDRSGNISPNRGARGSQVEIAGSPLSSQQAIQAAAVLVAKMTKYMPPNVFTSLASNAAVGVFTAREKLTVFPEFANLANGNCGTSCTGSCAHTCTFDGRKWETIAGIGAQRGAILDDNILCTPQDPYRGQENILSHEFTHTIHNYGLSDTDKQNVKNAYNNAKARNIWTLSSYAMSNEMEYFAEAASVFFFVNTDTGHSGGMNFCSPTAECRSEQDARNHLRISDIGLYNVLTYVFTNNRPQLASTMTICPNGSGR